MGWCVGLSVIIAESYTRINPVIQLFTSDTKETIFTISKIFGAPGLKITRKMGIKRVKYNFVGRFRGASYRIDI